MLDKERLLRIVGDTERYFNDLKGLKAAVPLSKDKFYSLSMLLFAILNRAIDLGEEIVKGDKLGVPSSYKEIFILLQRNKVITPELEKKLEYLVSKRNVLAHEYHDVTEESIYQIYTKIDAVTELLESVKKHIKNKQK